MVFLPPGLPLALETDFGDIVVRRLDNPVRARSMSGRITIAARGAIEAGSARGEIRVFPMEVPEGARYRIETEGDALLDLPLYAPLALSIAGQRGAPRPAGDRLRPPRAERGGRARRAPPRRGHGSLRRARPPGDAAPCLDADPALSLAAVQRAPPRSRSAISSKLLAFFDRFAQGIRG
ncbi:MAG: hypothetical protein RML12_11325 [Xanthomonadales bacterium]|nr:hypothetical protein [Xanthomonadales bacterium]